MKGPEETMLRPSIDTIRLICSRAVRNKPKTEAANSFDIRRHVTCEGSAQTALQDVLMRHIINC